MLVFRCCYCCCCCCCCCCVTWCVVLYMLGTLHHLLLKALRGGKCFLLSFLHAFFLFFCLFSRCVIIITFLPFMWNLFSRLQAASDLSKGNQFSFQQKKKERKKKTKQQKQQTRKERNKDRTKERKKEKKKEKKKERKN